MLRHLEELIGFPVVTPEMSAMIRTLIQSNSDSQKNVIPGSCKTSPCSMKAFVNAPINCVHRDARTLLGRTLL